MRKHKFKKRYVLGTGYPWALGVDNHNTIALCQDRVGVNYIDLDFPIELWDNHLPEYDLVLIRKD